MKKALLTLVVPAVLLVAAPAWAAHPAPIPGETFGVVDDSGLWTLRDQAGSITTIGYGNPGDVPFMGDWDCDGVDTPGLYRQSDGFAYLRNSNSTGVADVTFLFGIPNDVPVVGDFDGDGCDTLSIYRPAEARFYIINELGENGGGLGFADYSFVYGVPGDEPFVGDWDGDGIDTPGLRRSSDGFVYLRNSNDAGFADISYFYGIAGDVPIAGDWDDDGDDTVSLYRPSDSTFYLRNTNSTGIADVSVPLPLNGSRPVAGLFDLDLGVAPAHLKLTPIASGLSRPLFVSAPVGDDRLFVVEQTGDIELFVDNAGWQQQAQPFLSLGVTFSSERGLLGLAFHPDYESNGKFFVNYTIGSLTRISEFTVSGNPNLADASSERVLLEVTQPFSNHNGGMLQFDPGGHLLIALGDGGGSGDPGNRAENPHNLLGKILRIDVDNSEGGKPYAIPGDNPFEQGGGAPEVYVIGLRNPWRFDQHQGRLYVADVGQDRREEITVFQPGNAPDLGWNMWEGHSCFDAPCTIGGKVFPQVEYSHPSGCSVTGGFVATGADMPGWEGTYLYGDFCGGWIKSFTYENGVVGSHRELTPQLGVVPLLSSFGMDGHGRMYVASLSGGVVSLIEANP